MKKGIMLASHGLMAAILLSGCSSQPAVVPDKKPGTVVVAQAITKAEFGSWGVQTQYISTTQKPGDDFYRYVNQGWLESARIQPGFPVASAFLDLQLRTEKQIQAILDDVKSRKSAAGTAEQQLADLHASYADVARRNALGASLLLPEVKAVLQADRRELARRMGSTGYNGIVDIGVMPDATSPGQYRLAMVQADLGLPGRDYYLGAGEPYAGFRQAYERYIAGVFTRAGVAGAKEKAAAVLKFETALAEKQWSPAEQRDTMRNQHPMAATDLAIYAPGFDWSAFMAASGFADVASLNVETDTAVRDSAALFARAPLSALQAYTAFHLLDNYAPLLSEEWEAAHFDFYSRTLTGVAEQRSQEVRALKFVNETLGEQLGRLYVQRYFPPESKQKIDELVSFLRQAFRQRLEKVEWMDEATRKQALLKLDAMTTKIGYPEKWHDYSALEIKPDDLVGNMRRVQEWWKKDSRAKLDEPVRKWEWGMNPQVINAYNSPLANEIVFPAAILQPPFFDPQADPAVNFGAIGMVIGHEMGHSFDDQGSRYDGKGRLRNWWSDTSRQQFEQRTEKLVQQYDHYSPLPGLNLKGQLTLGENIGDLGGMTIAWTGYQNFVARQYAGQAPVLDGYSGNQRFFMSFAQLWRNLATEGHLRQQVLTDPHSPGEYRVNGVLANFTPWYETFDIKAADKLFRPESERVQIW